MIAGTLLTHSTPVYPKDAKKKHITGTVVLHAVIGKDGKIADLSVLCGPVELQASSLDAIKQWTYIPYLLNGRPVAVDTTISVTYDMGIGSADRAKQIRKQSGLPDELPSDDWEVRKAKKVAPVYPAEAKRQGIGGDVSVSVLVGLDGHVDAAHAISGPELLRDAAVDSVQKWTFKPYAPFGQAEKFHTVVTVKFKVD